MRCSISAAWVSKANEKPLSVIQREDTQEAKKSTNAIEAAENVHGGEEAIIS